MVKVESNIESLEDESKEASQAFEHGRQATIDMLKKLNLGMNENLRPFFSSMLLSPLKGKSYHELLLIYKKC